MYEMCSRVIMPVQQNNNITT